MIATKDYTLKEMKKLFNDNGLEFYVTCEDHELVKINFMVKKNET